MGVAYTIAATLARVGEEMGIRTQVGEPIVCGRRVLERSLRSQSTETWLCVCSMVCVYTCMYVCVSVYPRLPPFVFLIPTLFLTLTNPLAPLDPSLSILSLSYLSLTSLLSLSYLSLISLTHIYIHVLRS